jgi:hypothetical protein
MHNIKTFSRYKKVGAVEKVNFLCDTPIPIAIGTPRGDLLKSSNLESPPWGVGGKNGLLNSPILIYNSFGSQQQRNACIIDDLLIRIRLINRFTYMNINQVNKSIKKESIIMNT